MGQRHRNALKSLKCAAGTVRHTDGLSCKTGAQVEREEVPHYAEGAQYLKSLGFRNASEISRILDIAMNPNSLYLKDKHKRRSVNSSVSMNAALLMRR